MSGRRRAVLFAAITVIAAALGVPASASAVSSEPSIQIQTTEIRTGEGFDVVLRGWPAGVVSVALCGARGVAGSSDCATEQSALAVVDTGGTGLVSLVGAVPPSPCPCVVRARALTGDVDATLPVVIPEAGQSADVVEPGSIALPVARFVVAASLGPSGEWIDTVLALLGAPSEYRLAVTVQNTGAAASEARTTDVVVGRDSLGGDVVASLPLDPIAPGELVTHVLDVRIGAPLVGTYIVHGEIDPADNGSIFVAEVTSWPVVTGILVLLVAGWAIFARRARRVERERGTRVPWPVPVFRAVFVTALSAAVIVGANWSLSRLVEHYRATEAQSAMLDGFVSAPSAANANGRQIVTHPATHNLPATGDMVGVIRIPGLDTSGLAVVAGVTPEQLARGPGHYPGTALPGELGNVVVAGHNSRSNAGAPFVHLDRVEIGESIVFETAVGAWTYTVTGKRVVEPTAVSVLLPVRDDAIAAPVTSQLTLITCDYSLGATNRLIIEAEIVDPMNAAP